MCTGSDISQRVRDRANEIANDADVRMTPPPEGSPVREVAKLRTTGSDERTKTVKVDVSSDDRLPPPGTTLTRKYKGQMYQVRVLPVGFDFDGEVYKSLRSTKASMRRSWIWRFGERFKVRSTRTLAPAAVSRWALSKRDEIFKGIMMTPVAIAKVP